LIVMGRAARARRISSASGESPSVFRLPDLDQQPPVPAQLLEHHALGMMIPVLDRDHLAEPHRHETGVRHRTYGDLPEA
jgi:hypothetical protein